MTRVKVKCNTWGEVRVGEVERTDFGVSRLDDPCACGFYCFLTHEIVDPDVAEVRAGPKTL